MGMFDWMFGPSASTQGGGLGLFSQAPSGGALYPAQVTNPLTGANPNQQKWMDALAGIGAALKDSGAYLQHQPEAAGNVSAFTAARDAQLKQQQQAQIYSSLLPQLVGVPQQTADVDTQTPGAIRYSGGSLPQSQADVLGPLLSKFSPDVGLPVALSLIQKQLEPKAPIDVAPDHTLLNANDFKPLYTAPPKDEYGEPVTVAGIDGRPQLVRFPKNGGAPVPVGGYAPRPPVPDDLEKQGLALYGPNYQQNPEFQAALKRRMTGLLSPEQEAQQLRIAQGKHDITVNSSQYNLTPDETDALNAGIKDGTIDPNKVTSRTAKIFATMKLADPSTDFVSAGGVANLKKNPAVQQKIMAAKTIPTILDNLEEAGKKLNLSDAKFVGGIQNWVSGQTNDPDYIAYMTQRNDAILRIAYAMRGTGMSDEAAKLEQEVAKPTMSPTALHAYVQAQMKSLQPMLDQYAGIDARPGMPGPKPASPAASVPTATGPNGQKLYLRDGKWSPQ